MCDPTVRCVDGAWMHPGCVTPGPHLAEGCRSPALGPFPGLVLAIDPVPVEFVWGVQGSAMIEYRIAVEPGEGVPSCVMVRTRLTLDGETVENMRPLRLRCGRSETIQEIVPGLPCEERSYEGSLELEVIGVGTQTIDFSLPGEHYVEGFPPPCGSTPD